MSLLAANASAGAPRKTRWRRGCLFLAVLFFVCVSGGLGYRWFRGEVPEPPMVSYEGAEAAVSDAIEKARAEVRRQPRSAVAWGQLGKLFRAHAYDEAANRCFTEASRLDPRDPHWPYYLGVRRLLHAPDEAVPYLRKAVQLCAPADEYRSAARLRLAETLLEQGQLDEAEELFRLEQKTEPDNPRVRYGLALVRLEQQDKEGCAALLERLTEDPFARKKADAQLAALALARGDATAAARFSEQARLLPRDLDWLDPFIKEYLELAVGRQSRVRLAEQMEREGQRRDAVKLLRELAREYPDAQTLATLGIGLAKVGDFTGAEEVLRAALRQVPGKVQAHYFLSVSLFVQGERLWRQSNNRALAEEKFRQAAASARRATELKPDHAFAFVYLGLSQRILGHRQEGLEALRQAVRCAPEHADPHLHLGEALAAEGDVEEALIHLQHAVEVAPSEDARPRAALARVRDLKQRKNVP